ncbi:uncharacterized protein LOC132194423 [Neocloeon triangulifer]|uniref:uncharacterized protein LOC132194423 n=1 Tax=Neocloeon triangulifer TaxID=2078957 RepID=UPI00286FAA0A|nr:uncharacterized protein LOC132194423 [Neocloeon triangulifer]
MNRQVAAKMCILAIFLSCLVLTECKKKKGRNHPRKIVALCCGRYSCTNFEATEIITKATYNSSKVWSTLKMTTFSTEMTDTRILEQETVEETSDTTVTQAMEEPTSMRETETTSTLTESTITSTTTATSTTTTSLNACPKDCTKDGSLFESDGTLKNSSSYGFWETSCDTLILFGSKIVNWEENVKICCQLGMTPLKISTSAKQSCLNSIVNVSTWRYNYNYWTYGLKFNDSDKEAFWWCDPISATEVSNGTIEWQAGQPDNVGGSENCLHLQVVHTDLKMVVTNRNCADKYMLACESMSTTPAPKCTVGKCPDITCVRNEELFYNKTITNNPNSPLLDPSAYGTWQSTNGRMYLFSKNKATWNEAYNICCSLNLKFLSVEQKNEMDTLVKSVNTNGNISQSTYWTSGTDADCSGKHAWCAVSKSFRDVIWDSGEPGNSHDKSCVTLSLSKSNAKLGTEDCKKNLNFICEVRDTSNSTTSGMAITNECAHKFQILDTNITNNITMNMSFASLDTKTKCYLKCVAEEAGFINVNGVKVDINTIAKLEIASANDKSKLQNSFVAADDCGKKRGVDECDTAILIYECGKSKVPEVVNDVVVGARMENKEEAPLPRNVAKCITDFSCLTNSSMRNAFLSNSSIDSGTKYTACGRKYVVSNVLYNFTDAASYCCQLGLSIASFETYSEYTCVQNMIPTSTTSLILWTSGSQWTVNDYYWCPSGVKFFPEAKFANSVNATPNAFLATVNYLKSQWLSGLSTTATFNFNKQPSSFLSRVLCEENDFLADVATSSSSTSTTTARPATTTAKATVTTAIGTTTTVKTTLTSVGTTTTAKATTTTAKATTAAPTPAPAPAPKPPGPKG